MELKHCGYTVFYITANRHRSSWRCDFTMLAQTRPACAYGCTFVLTVKAPPSPSLHISHLSYAFEQGDKEKALKAVLDGDAVARSRELARWHAQVSLLSPPSPDGETEDPWSKQPCHRTASCLVCRCVFCGREHTCENPPMQKKNLDD